jgi:GntR family transcriptional repressor for pyruvate dehydrogenase complex
VDQPGLTKPNLSAYLSSQIQNLIRTNDLKPGDRLPSARALAEQFNVATPTIREALRRLQATGLIDIRHGSGIYVRRQSDRLMLSNPGYGALETQTILQVLDARALIEPHLAGLAAQFATPSEIEGLQDLIRRADAAVERTDDSYIRVNYELHAAIARASGNLVLTHIVESLHEMYSTELHLTDPRTGYAVTRARDHDHHHMVVDAIANRDVASATTAMTEHINAARETVVAQVTAAAQASKGADTNGTAASV